MNFFKKIFILLISLFLLIFLFHIQSTDCSKVDCDKKSDNETKAQVTDVDIARKPKVSKRTTARMLSSRSSKVDEQVSCVACESAKQAAVVKNDDSNDRKEVLATIANELDKNLNKDNIENNRVEKFQQIIDAKNSGKKKIIIGLGTPFTTISLGMTTQFFPFFCDEGYKILNSELESNEKPNYTKHADDCKVCKEFNREAGRDKHECLMKIVGSKLAKFSFLNLHFTLDHQIDKFIHGPSIQFTYAFAQYGLLTVGYSCGYLINKSRSYNLFIKGGANYVRMMPHSDRLVKKSYQKTLDEVNMNNMREEEEERRRHERAKKNISRGGEKMHVGLADQNWIRLVRRAKVGVKTQEVGAATLFNLVPQGTENAKSFTLPTNCEIEEGNTNHPFHKLRDGQVIYYQKKIDLKDRSDSKGDATAKDEFKSSYHEETINEDDFSAQPTNGVNPYVAFVWHDVKGSAPSHALELGVIIWDNLWNSDREIRDPYVVKHSFRCISKWNCLIRYNLLWRLM